MSAAPTPAIVVRNLEKHYGEVAAVRGIDFDVHSGEVFGLLGPNGAGKTTTVEILEGLRPRSGGTVTVLGLDPADAVNAIKDRVGVCLQATNLPEKLKVHEAVELFSAFYTRCVDGERLLKRLQLWEKRDAFYGKLSGGQKQRLALALALVNDPQIVFLDEPSTGLDPQIRLEIHALVEELRRERRTILLTTHYIEEAERLCDRVAILDEGRIIALGTPRDLQAQTFGHSFIEIQCARPIPPGEAPPAVEGGRIVLDDDRTTLTASAPRAARTLVDLVKWIDGLGVELEDIHLKRPTLEDVFIELTGKRLRE